MNQDDSPARPVPFPADYSYSLTGATSLTAPTPVVTDLLCFAHLRWNFVYQRPQHLLSRWQGLAVAEAGAANTSALRSDARVWYVEEPQWGDTLRLDIRPAEGPVRVVVPCLPAGIDADTTVACQRQLLDQLIEQEGLRNVVAWYYTPMALAFSDHLTPRLTVYDCMDELSAFAGAAPDLLRQEKRLLARADLLFTGGYSLYEAKRARHEQVFTFPSGIDYEHFAQARTGLPDPADQRHLPRPRIGYSGVIDERMDLNLLRELARDLPDWQFMLLGPVVKIDPASLPQAPNLHYLGRKAYAELPAYFSNWTVALLPFARNDATRYISPTKTPEYLAAGLPVLATPIHDVVRTYGCWEQVLIADSVGAIEQALALAVRQRCPNWTALDAFLREQSWDNTWEQMQRIMTGALLLRS